MEGKGTGADTPDRPGWRLARRVASVGALVLGCGALAAGRGLLLARLIGGFYRWRDLAWDSAGLLALVVALRLVDAALQRGLARLTRGRGRRARGLAWGARVVFLLGLGGPFVLVTVLVHPARIGCSGTPARLHLAYRSVALEAQDGARLSGWYVPASDERRPVVLVAHGLGANKDNFLAAARVVHRLGYGALLFDFRGHGNSERSATTFGYREALDVKAACDWLVRRFPGRRIYGLGYSLGGAAILQAATRYDLPFRKVVLDSTYASAEGVARKALLRRLGPLRGAVWQLGRAAMWLWTGVDPSALRSDRLLAQISRHTPVLLVHGDLDAVIPVSESKGLRRASEGRAELWIVPGVAHAGALGFYGYTTRLRRFFSRRGPGASLRTPRSERDPSATLHER